MPIVADRVAEITATTGTGTIQLGGAKLGYQTFVAGVGSGQHTYYTILDPVTGDWEVGSGLVTVGTPSTLTRATVYDGSNGPDVHVSFGEGTKDVFVTAAASRLVLLDPETDALTIPGDLALTGHITATGTSTLANLMLSGAFTVSGTSALQAVTATTVTVTGVNGVNAASVTGGPTTDSSFGLIVSAGTSAADRVALFRDVSGASALLIAGDKSVTAYNGLTVQAGGIASASGALSFAGTTIGSVSSVWFGTSTGGGAYVNAPTGLDIGLGINNNTIALITGGGLTLTSGATLTLTSTTVALGSATVSGAPTWSLGQTFPSLTVSSTIAAGNWSATVLGASGAARDLLIVGVSGVSNGLTVQWNGAHMIYRLVDLPTSASGLLAGTVWNNSGALSVA